MRAEVVSVSVVEEPLLAYNLTVEGFHTYFVAGDAAVWVHNNCINGKTRLNDGSEIDISKADNRVDHALRGDVGPNGATGGHSTNSGSVRTVGYVEVGHGGVRRAQVEINGQIKSNSDGISTLFPESWSDQRIVIEFSLGLRTGATSSNPSRGAPRVVTVEFQRSGGQINTLLSDI